jgi:hypothetical protein
VAAMIVAVVRGVMGSSRSEWMGAGRVGAVYSGMNDTSSPSNPPVDHQRVSLTRSR